jgi:mannitol/fructose-specific phosphotransferase system IIA component (Ntr-type)
MDLATLITPNVTKVPLEAFDKEEAIAELVEVLVRARKVSDRDGLLTALYEREDKGSTGIGGGVAIPHAKQAEISGVVMAAGVSRDGIEFDAADGELVYVVFLVLAEVHNPGPNVEVLAEIGHMMQVPGVYERMVAAKDAAGLCGVIQGSQVEP